MEILAEQTSLHALIDGVLELAASDTMRPNAT
jgi:hypothetical protein